MHRITPDHIVEINIHDKVVGSFPVLDVFVKVAAHIARGGTLEVIGKTIKEIKPITNLMPFVSSDQSQLIENVIFIDRYDNVITTLKNDFLNLSKKAVDLKYWHQP